MTWTNNQKIAVLKSIGFIIGADGKIHPNEILVLKGFCNRYGLNIDTAMREQDQMTANEMRTIISDFSTADKKLVLSYWKEAMMCDGEAHPNELETVVLMAMDCVIPLDNE